ncbi:DUF4179 domain-containing protein [Clostridium weizhouense]|uniref:DUF4179 domain-containing protein n=1 Tax=Clostridium weizhouense TaxID=2859781 RepID=A0ABS7APP1_9CLOT|nr:DUF4179 domain-containing protein [Clostridium weizhouense]MBW6410635.1 DUF4179 domain-containing protein [Clostridium weizhouense]
MANRKISRILGPILGVMVFMASTGVAQVKVLADDNVGVTSASYENTVSNEEKDYSININKSVKQNGFKITLDKVTGTKHALKAVVKIESDKPFDREKYNNIISELTFGKSDCWGGGESQDYINDKTLLLTIEKEIDDEEFPEKGELRVDIVMPNHKINVGIDAYVDFSESFKKTLELNLSSKIPEFNSTLNKLESNVMGTKLEFIAPWKDFDERREDPLGSRYSSMILKVGDKMYKTYCSGSHSSDDKEMIKTYEYKSVTYDKIKDQQKLGLIPIVCFVSREERNKTYDEDEINNKKLESNKETLNNVRYLKEFEFSDGTKGEIYNIERKDNTVKVYCKGASEKESLLMADNMNMNYDFNEKEIKFNNIYNNVQNMSFYKDSNEDLGYVVEFNNVDKDRIINLNIEPIISQIDKFKVGDEVNI